MKKKYSPLDFRSFFKLLIISSFFFLISSCSEDSSSSSSEEDVFLRKYSCATCKTSPEALAENDNLSKGIYIGISDKGILYINIDNASNGVKSAYLLKDNIRKELFFIANHTDQDRYFALFADNSDVPITLKFDVKHNGDDPKIVLQNEIVYKTSNTLNTVFKEKSNDMIEVFEGKLLKKIVGNSNGKMIENVGNELIVVSRSREIWAEIRSIPTLIYSGYVIINTKNSGLIKGKMLIDIKNQKNGMLNSDSVSGNVYSESHNLSISLNRVL